MDRTMAWRLCGGMYMQPLKYRWPLVICQSSMDEQGNRGELTFKLSKAQSMSGSDLVEDQIFQAKARSSAWMMTGSGHIAVSWLSWVVSMWLCLDNASARAILVPGMTCHCILKSCRNRDHLACCLDSFWESLI